MPAYNNKATISAAIDAILGQTFDDIELIISDNCSTDGTGEICEEYARRDDRIRFFRQPENIGSERNFAFVYEQASGEYFMWAAAHYLRSLNFVESNLELLRKNPSCVCASAVSCFIGMEHRPEKLASFSLQGSLYDRFAGFLDNCWESHACYYSLFPRSALADYPDIKSVFLANDWNLDLHLLSKGEFLRSTDSMLLVGYGSSTQPGFKARSRTRPIHYLLPFYEFSIRFVRLVARSHELSISQRTHLVSKLLPLNTPRFARRGLKVLRRAVRKLSGPLALGGKSDDATRVN
jgi:glycosyltransferase involved in cell wall biosynthesis